MTLLFLASRQIINYGVNPIASLKSQHCILPRVLKLVIDFCFIILFLNTFAFTVLQKFFRCCNFPAEGNFNYGASSRGGFIHCRFGLYGSHILPFSPRSARRTRFRRVPDLRFGSIWETFGAHVAFLLLPVAPRVPFFSLPGTLTNVHRISVSGLVGGGSDLTSWEDPPIGVRGGPRLAAACGPPGDPPGSREDL